MKIAFHDNAISLRGTTVALYNYAYYTRKYLGNESIILYNKKHKANSTDALNRFKKEFEVFGYNNINEIDDILKRENCDCFFAEKGGKKDGVVSSVATNLIHAIAVCNENDIHGDVFVMGSEWLSKIVNYKIPFLPYIVTLPEINTNMRSKLNIEPNAFVIGRNGGYETFDLDFAKDAIREVLNQRNDIYFIFQNTEKFINHDRVVFLSGTSDMKTKVEFINSCDMMIHSRRIGESFGLSCAEFSIRNKPIITWLGSKERNHIDILGDKGFYYNDKKELKKILLQTNKSDLENKDWNCYRNFEPKKVIEKFEKIYLK